MSTLRRWSEDRTVGQALIVAGVVILVVQVMPWKLIHVASHLWPLALVAIGAILLVGRRRG